MPVHKSVRQNPEERPDDMASTGREHQAGAVPERIRVGHGLPDFIGQPPDTIEILSSVGDMSDAELSRHLQDAVNGQIKGLEVLGDLEAEVFWLETNIERKMDIGVSRLMTDEPIITKQLGSGRNSLSPLRGYVVDHDAELSGWMERAAEQKTLLLRVKKHVDSLTIHRETLSRQVAIRQMETEKGLRG